MKANLTRYSLWQAIDFARERGIALLLVGTLIGFTIIAPVRAMGREIDAGIAKTLITTALSQVAFILAFITLNGIVSTDRKQGYFRFLFSKPVSIPAYYSQLFVVYLLGFLVSVAILLGGFAMFAHPVSPFAPLLYCALLYLSMGGLAFLISTLFRHDWSILAAVLLASTVLHSLWQYQEGWRRLVLSIMPPVYRLSGMLPDIMNKGTVNTEDVLWLLGYSAICFVGGLLILRRRPFA